MLVSVPDVPAVYTVALQLTHLVHKRISKRLFLACWDLHAISLGRQVPKNHRRVRSARRIDWRRQGAADNHQVDSLWLVV